MSSLTQSTSLSWPDTAARSSSATVADALEALASNSSIEERGAIFTRVEVVEFMLDLVGYIATEPLHQQVILEPAFGAGDFLLPIIDRLLAAWKKYAGDTTQAFSALRQSICGVELHRETFSKTRQAVINRLINEGLAASIAVKLADQWLTQGDFLLEQHNACFNFVVGNPPYVRQELIPAPLLAAYRQRYQTMYDRADLYIPFIERSLSLLTEGGNSCLICADRWMKNRYGGPLRAYIAQHFHLKAYVDMVDVGAFQAEVSAYPAITVISKSPAGNTRIAHKLAMLPKTLQTVAADIRSHALSPQSTVREMTGVTRGAEPWLLASSDQLSLIRRIESTFPALEQTGCKVGIGVATGADKAFIGRFDSLDVESNRKLPMVATRDIKSGEVIWQGQGVINPFAEDGSLVNLQHYPKLSHYFNQRKAMIAKRHCAKKSPANWYRTIDRIWPDLTHQPKLLIPDIKGEAHIVFEPGRFYPHHNLYYIVADTWDLRALQAVLLSSITKLFVSIYSTKMRGGYWRFQAQYLRRICIPRWKDVAESLRQELIIAAHQRDVVACNQAVGKLYQLNQQERSALGGNG